MGAPFVIQVSMADLATFQFQVALGLSFALDRRGLLSRYELADELEEAAAAMEADAARDLVKLLIAGLRDEPEPPPDLTVIEGGKA
jgi:hypothetical protein